LGEALQVAVDGGLADGGVLLVDGCIHLLRRGVVVHLPDGVEDNLPLQCGTQTCPSFLIFIPIKEYILSFAACQDISCRLLLLPAASAVTAAVMPATMLSRLKKGTGGMRPSAWLARGRRGVYGSICNCAMLKWITEERQPSFFHSQSVFKISTLISSKLSTTN